MSKLVKNKIIYDTTMLNRLVINENTLRLFFILDNIAFPLE